MRIAYLDTSYLLSILFGEPGARKLQSQLMGYTRVFSADLLVAETWAAATREGVGPDEVEPVLESVGLVFPDHSLNAQIGEVLAQGYLRGADLWHLSCAMFLAGPDRSVVDFLSRDQAQRTLARRLGFPTP